MKIPTMMKPFIQKNILDIAVEAYKQAETDMEKGEYDVKKFKKELKQRIFK
jgi:hypothetical protein